MFGKKETVVEPVRDPVWKYQGKNFSLFRLDHEGDDDLGALDELLSNGWELLGISGTYYKFAVIRRKQPSSEEVVS